jgi:hypothetical protein
MAASSGATGSGDPDMVLIGELMEEMSRRPPAIAARKLLIEHYIAVGWIEAALDNTKELKALSWSDPDVVRFLQVLEKKPEPPSPEKIVLPPAPKYFAGRKTNDGLVWDAKTGQYKKETASKPKNEKIPQNVIANVEDDLDAAQQDLITGYRALRARANFVLRDLMHLQALQKKESIVPSRNTARIQKIVNGQADAPTQLRTPRSTARSMRDNPKAAADLAIADLEEAVEWYKRLPGTDTDKVRDAIVKRKAALEVALPDELKFFCGVALMHLEHEQLGRNYTNTETMYGDAVKDIPRSNFYVTEDNYAWDMDELVAAIKAGSGVLRNPLSKQMFTPTDVKGIYSHRLATPLAALAVEQREMSKGIRPETISRMEKLSSVLLEDQSADTLPSRHAVDEFLAYVATCKYSCHRY